MNAEIDIEDVLGPVGVGLLAAGLYLIGLGWMLLFLGADLTRAGRMDRADAAAGADGVVKMSDCWRWFSTLRR